jgi:hypothetical protein
MPVAVRCGRAGARTSTSRRCPQAVRAACGAGQPVAAGRSVGALVGGPSCPLPTAALLFLGIFLFDEAAKRERKCHVRHACYL